MNSNLFERKNYIDRNLISTNISDWISTKTSNENIILKVNLLRATANEANYLKKYFDEIPIHNEKSVIIDLSKCNFIDSTFLSSIIIFNKKTNTEIKLVVSDSRQLTIFKITKLDLLFNIYSSLDQALTA